MQPIIAPIKLKEQSANAANLQAALTAMGYKLNTGEVNKQTAGDTTIKAVRNIQLKNKLHFDDTLLVDQTTADLLNRMLKDKGLLTEDKKYSVSGKVLNSAGEGLGGKPVLAYDVDLKGARIYKTAKTTDELKSSGGMELLGKAVSQPDGSYTITFSADQFSHAEQGLADVVVYVVKGRRIIGLSNITTDADYVDGLSIENLNVVLSGSTERGISEFTLLLKQVNAFLGISNVKMQDIYDSPDQVSFLASEIKQDRNKIQLLVQAAQMAGSFPGDQFAHELLYGLGRESILLSFDSIAISPEVKLLNAWQQAIQDNIIDPIDNEITGTFLTTLHNVATQQVITSANGTAAPLSKALSFATANTNIQAAFVNADRSFNGTPMQFWNEYLPQLPEFKAQPEVIQSLQLTNQLIALTGNHLPLVENLQLNRKIQNPSDLLQLSDTDWTGLLKSTGVPDGVPGTTDDEKISNYKGQLQTVLNAAFPTQKIALMVSDNTLKITDPNIKESLTSFFNEVKNFDISSSQIKDFETQLTRIAGSNLQACKDQLATLQRIYQVSPVPETMPVLLGLGYDSAYGIANIPQQSFIDMHSQDLGSDDLAMAIHQRASYQAMRLEHVAMTSYEIMNGVIPQAIIQNSQVNTLQQVILQNIPDYTELFGSPDICQCEECRSVYGAASYLVDIIQFLDKCGKNYFNLTPQAILLTRRPDLAFLPLTCENTNTIIPYIDLVNEIMEYYVVHAKLDSNAAHDTGDATADELRANPQYTLKEAYRKLKDAVYPFGLPYHQPLDAERIYFDQMHTSRAEVMEIMRNDLSSKTDKAINAEVLNLSAEEYSILTGINFDGTNDGKNVWEFYGYPDDNALQTNIFKVPEFLKRTGIQYADLISLLDTRFINPYQPVLVYIENLFSTSSLTPDNIYQKLQQIAANKLDPSADNDLMKVLNNKSISSADFKTWVSAHFAQFQSVITLYEPTSACELSSTTLRTLQSIYENLSGSGIPDEVYTKLHRFIRLWRKTGWLVTELDIIIFALGENDITGTLIDKLGPLLKITGSANLPLNKMATFWGNIQTFGNQALYNKLFLNKAIQRIDTAFSPDVWGNYLTDNKTLLNDHIPAVLAAFRLSAEELNIILNDNAIDLNTQVLSIENLSIIYRYGVLSKAIGISVTDICTLKQLFSLNPFSTYDTGQQKFININLQATLDFITLTGNIKSSGFKVKSLNYIIQGIADPKYNLALPEAAAQQALIAIRKGFLGIEQAHPDTDLNNVTEDLLRSKLQLIYMQDIVERLVSFLNGTAVFSVITGNNLPVTIPSPQNAYITYVKGSGRLQCTGVLSDDDKNILDGLSGGVLKTASLDLYKQPEQFIKDNFSALFNGNINNAIQDLLNHPKQQIPLTITEKWQLFYKAFLPYLKDRLRRNLIIQSISDTIRLDEPVTQILVNNQIDNIVRAISQMGLSATYYKDEVFNSAGLTRIDPQVDFSWQNNAPDINIPSDHFSVRWEGWLNPPVSNDFTLVVEVDDTDDAFTLYIDDQIAIQKNTGDNMLSKEWVMTLSAAKVYKLKLEYTEKINLAGVHLSWKTATSPKEIIDQVNLFPLIVYSQFYDGLINYHKAALFITGFNLKAAEVDHLIRHNINFNNIDFTALTSSCWQRIFNYTVVRKSLPGSLAGLTDLFELADSNNPAPTLDDIITKAIAISGWNKDYLTFLVKTQFNLQVTDFSNEAALLKLTDAMKLTLKTGALPNVLADWSKVETDFDKLYDQSQTIKNTVKSQFEENDWLQVAKKLSNLLREHQKEALIDYLLVQQELITWGVTDADSLFEYFLIDVQMDACMDTSRIKQAISSVQLFVSRCLLNIESRIDNSGNETGVSPAQMDKTSRIRWEWMNNYRVWEANRKVFLYPENWLDPELRDDKSEFFKALESELLQNDITSDTVDNAFYNYLDKLDEVSHLEICGTFQDNNNNILHVFGRSHAKPYIYYYRTYNMIFRHWSAWEKLQADIRGVDDTQDPGVHLTPIVWKDRLFIFWPEFLKKQEAKAPGNSQSYSDIAKNPVSDSVPESYWEVTLAWSEYKNGKWTPKSVSKEFLRPGVSGIIKLQYYKPNNSSNPNLLESAKTIFIRLH